MKYFLILGLIGISFLSFHLQETEARIIAPLHIVLEDSTIKQNSFITANGGVPDITIQKGATVSFPLTVNPRGSEPLPVNFFYSVEFAIPDTRQSTLPDMKIELDPFHMVLKPDEPQIMNVTITTLNYTQLGEHKIKLTAQYPHGEVLFNTRFDVLVMNENPYDHYKFIDFSYTHTVGEPIKFILEKTADADCNSYNAEIIDEEGNFVLGWGEEISCVPDWASSSIPVQTKIGYKESHPIIINDSGKYYLKIDFDDVSINKEFVVRQNHSGVSLDRTVYPVPWMIESPLKQFKSGIQIDDMQCKDGLVLIQKHDSSPACVTKSTKQKLVERGWTTKDSSVQKIIERLKQGPQSVDEVDANYIESLALMDPVVSNFVSGTNWESHCCGYSIKNDVYELTIIFLDIENQQQIGVTFDLSILGIIDIHNGRTRIIGGSGT